MMKDKIYFIHESSYVDDNVKGALGIMLDDIIAGAYSAITIYIFYALWF